MIPFKVILNSEFQSAMKKVSEVPRKADDAFKLLKWMKKLEDGLKEINELYQKMKETNPDADPLQDPDFLKVLEQDCGLPKLAVGILSVVDLTIKEASILEHVFEIE